MLKFVIPLSFILLVVAFWNRNDLDGNLPLLPQLNQEPIQTAASAEPFDTAVNDTHYHIEPLYDYELYGLVVSYNLHDGNYGLHKRWGDHLNVADICVVWQDTAFSKHLNKLDFWNGQFTCHVSTSSDAAWASFKGNQLANNHLITGDEFMRKQISKVGIGDQIKIRGWLASYSSENGGKRGTSTTREDTGNGACETIYVNDFQILESYSSGWRKLMYLALIIFISSLVLYFRQPFRTPH